MLPPGVRHRELEEGGEVVEEVEVCSCAAPAGEDVIAELNSLIASNYKMKSDFIVGTDQLCTNTYSCNANVGTIFSKHGVCSKKIK